ncbi:hypothetical protein [Nocardia salmonicida]|uniref:hypothetical protein n=1 Tax=Nocardia salmonicida TaxID=53431 RepID=UPI0033F76487
MGWGLGFRGGLGVFRWGELGAESFVYTHGAGTDWSTRSGKIVVRVDRRFQTTLGETLHLRPKPEEVFFFDADTELRLR